MFTAKVVRKQYVDLSKVARGLRGPSKVKVGLPAGEAESKTIQVGIWNHFGTRGGASGGGWGGPIPERPFLSNAMRSNRNEYKNSMKASAAKILRGDSTLFKELSRLGIAAAGDVQDEITSLSHPPNSPVTIAIKGSDNPLIDEGNLRKAITYKVDD